MTEKKLTFPKCQMSNRRWYRKLCYLYKIVVNKSLNYLFKVAPSSNTIYNTRNTNNIPLVNINCIFFKNAFFPSIIIEWNNLYPAIRISTSFNSFKESILKFIIPKGIKYFTRLRVNFSLLRDYKFRHSFHYH